MRLVILDNYDLASEWAAKYVRNRILQFAPTAEKPFVLGLPTGQLLYGTWYGLLSVCILLCTYVYLGQPDGANVRVYHALSRRV